MKTIGLLLLLNVSAWACKSGYVPTDVPGVCQEGFFTKTDPAIVSDEKPPTDKMPSWQREGVIVVDRPRMAAQDEEDDLKKAAADKEGKKRAGLK